MSAAAMRPDHYATLGIAPTASAAEIRAAYLTLMRAHHPDRNPSPDSVERAKAIIAAFKVLSDFDQRSHYDWDQRRDRERAAARAAVPDRTLNKKAVVVGMAGAGLVMAAMAAWSIIVPTSDRPVEVASTDRPAAIPAAPEPSIEPTPRPAREPRETIIRMRAVVPQPEPAQRVVAKEAVRTVAKTVPKKEIAEPVRVATVAPAPRSKPKVAEPPPPRVAAKPPPPVRVASPAAPTPPKPRQSAARPVSDIASLDQFVMSFYGQSWRYGDAPKRAVLEKTRASFVARRGACTGDTCRRNAYLDLMRDVSSIVETGKPEPR